MTGQANWNGWDAIIDIALAEDVGTGDITTMATVAPDARSTARLVTKAAGVLSGVGVARQVFARVDSTISFETLVDDGGHVPSGTVIAAIEGPSHGILIAERTALNLIQHLSGIATLTCRYVDAVEGTGACIIDTRKTLPGLRMLEKAAVRHGGGKNHRIGLSDGVLIKDNHLAAIGGEDRVTRAIAAARATAPHTLRVEVEVTTLDEVHEAVAAGADAIMLDNMNIDAMREAVAIVGGRSLTEASGGVNLETVRQIAETGVDLISVGRLTHSAPALDISLQFDF
ncbi:MAG TPA: carboxylating nicotinate-nucleotide diphosphorylase [Thermomicrobiales bacterium]|jgi:nicotinate-nucleotide pyrophosphorylase (carboxylating)|nr:carboxylating nicotinate-nucleotide diphosphorylase [Thermomicrobiales bacterium]